jgi:hypothetical protein
MFNNKLASKLKALVNNKMAWEALEEYLQAETQKTHRALVVAQSEQEMFRSQGKAILLETLLNLKNNVQDFEKNNKGK